MPSWVESARSAGELEATLVAEGELVLDRLDRWCDSEGGADRACLYYGDDDRELSFAEARDWSARLAGGFAAMGVVPGDRVALLLANPLATVLAMLALWRLDAVYCPVNHNLTGRLLAHPLRQLQPRLLVIEEGRCAQLDDAAVELGSLPPLAVHRPRADEHDHQPAARGARPTAAAEVVELADLLASSPASRASQRPRSAAAILQTSGTTGPAKGVVLSHRWLNQYTWAPRHLVDRDDVIHNDLPLYHGAGAFANVARALWAGCEVALWDRFSASDFWRRIERRGATNAILIDVMISRLMAAEERPGEHETSLHTVNLTPLPAHHHQVASRFGLDLCGTAYGQTETGNGAFALIDELPDGGGTPVARWRGKAKEEVLRFAREHGYPVLRGDAPVRRGLMGTPSIFLEAAILGPDDQPLGDESYGQLAFRGRLPHLLCDGYFGRSEATAELFGGGWLHTGDAAVRDAEGIYYFVDRMGSFIRSKGENISSYEVEDAINAHPAVAMSAAIGVPAREGLEEDVAVFVVARPGATLDADMLAAFCSETMPRYLRPRHFRVIEEMPRTPTDKIEKYKLRDALLRELGESAGGDGYGREAGR